MLKNSVVRFLKQPLIASPKKSVDNWVWQMLFKNLLLDVANVKSVNMWNVAITFVTHTN
jgi:hypothetical protein